MCFARVHWYLLRGVCCCECPCGSRYASSLLHSSLTWTIHGGSSCRSDLHVGVQIEVRDTTEQIIDSYQDYVTVTHIKNFR
uniref:Secreted protein n=1 Tax=Physcomitrium patens TaxID=3218 RepID=A0A2K1J072_PHYPA|nr:hypothetical protein PHYPA_022826 [Physcomitrium patens]